MKPLVQIADMSRRDAIRAIALALTAGGGMISRADAQHVHAATAAGRDANGDYEPKLLTGHEYETVTRLAALIVPADEKSGSAADAGAAEFIDLLCSQNPELAAIYTGGILWLDSEMRHRHDKSFLAATEAHQSVLLDDLAAAERAENERRASNGETTGGGPYSHFAEYGVEKPGPLGPGVRFFGWVRNMSVDAYYTSPIGFKDLGYMGGGAVSEYTVPKEAIEYGLARLPFKTA
jgi:hypothetical protein